MAHPIFLYSGEEENEERVKWNEFHVYLDTKGKEIVDIPADGLCFFRSVQNWLGIQYNEKYSMAQIQKKIVEEIATRPKFYLGFFPEGKNRKVIVATVENFFKDRCFASATVDMLIGASCNAFGITLWIYQKDENDFMHSIQYGTGQDIQKRRHCHLILYRNRQDVKGLGSHYNSVVSKKKNKGRPYEDYGAAVEVENDAYKRRSRTPDDEQNYMNDFQFEDLGPPNPGMVLTPTPSPNNTFDDFNPTYIRQGINTERIFDQPEAAIYNSRSQDERINFPYSAAADLPTENTDKVPYNINGNHHYKIDVGERDWHKIQEDGRWCFMRSSTTRKSNNVRKIGKCLGSYKCENDLCPKFTSGKGRNTYAFTRIGLNLYECKTCGSVAKRDFCGALKLTVYNPDTKTLEVTYMGHHTCSLRSRASYTLIASPVKRSILQPILQKNVNATAKQISEEAAENFLRMGKPAMAKESVKLSQDRRLVSSMKEEILKIVGKRDPNSFHAIANLRRDLKTVDPYLIFKLNDGSLNDDISYVFKSSKCAAELAIEMDCEDENSRSCLKEEPVYVDTMHSRVDDYKNITAWVKNPITRSVMRIATMEAKKENTPTMVLFFRTLNEMLAQVSGKKRYKFNPWRFYVDEGGANKNAIKEVYGTRGLNKTVTCQYHFLKCAKAKQRHVKEKWRKSFYKLCKRMVKAPTRSEYEALSNLIKKICAESGLLEWFMWWDDRKFHIIPAFRGFNLSGLNLAESGQSGMKPKTRKKLKLIDAAYKDCSQMLRQDETYRAYIGNISKEIGKGLNIRQIQERDRRAQEERAKSYSRALFTGDVNAETDEDEDGNQPCLPQDIAKHKAPRTYSRKNPTQRKKRKQVEDEDENVFDSDLSSIHEDECEEVPGFIDEDYIRSVRATKIIRLNPTIRKCYTCDYYFEHNKIKAPMDLVFTRKTRRMQPDGAGGEIRNKIPTNAFFCIRDMACLEVEFPEVKKDNLYMSNVAFGEMTPVHKKFLKLKGYWDPIIRNRRRKAAFQ